MDRPSMRIKKIHLDNDLFLSERSKLFDVIATGVPVADTLDNYGVFDERITTAYGKLYNNLPLTKDEVHIIAARRFIKTQLKDPFEIYDAVIPGESVKNAVKAGRYPEPKIRPTTIKPLYTKAWEKYLNDEELTALEFTLVTARIASGGKTMEVDDVDALWNKRVYRVSDAGVVNGDIVRDDVMTLDECTYTVTPQFNSVYGYPIEVYRQYGVDLPVKAEILTS